jgi:8-oxo-dGTP diphosphatase
MQQTVADIYGHQLRVRVCGICIENDKILLINHRGLTPTNVFWSPPGGGVNFGETLHEALKREFLEETGATIEVQDLMFINESLRLPFHAIEIFFSVKIIDGNIRLGTDTEMPDHKQIIYQINWLDSTEISHISAHDKHSIFANCKKIEDIYALKSQILNQ